MIKNQANASALLWVRDKDPFAAVNPHQANTRDWQEWKNAFDAHRHALEYEKQVREARQTIMANNAA